MKFFVGSFMKTVHSLMFVKYLKTYDSLTSKISSKNQTNYSLIFIFFKELETSDYIKIE